MPQRQVNIQTQEQRQLQQQHLSQLQLQVVRLLEMPLTQLEERITNEMDANPSLEPDYDAPLTDDAAYSPSSADGSSDISNDASSDSINDEQELRDDALTDALDRIGQDDRMEDYSFSDDYIPRSSSSDDNTHTFDNGNTISFIDTLLEQMRMEELTDEQRQIMEYLICSLEDDGLLHKDLMSIADELAIYNNIFVEPEDIEDVLIRLQNFDPPGIGGRDLRECLLLQVERMKATPLTMLMYRVINECYDDFSNNRWKNICRTLAITEAQADELRREIRHRLTPKPGSSLSEPEGHSTQQIVPDIILTVDYDNNIAFELNNGRIPTLHVVAEDEMFLKDMEQRTLTRADREAVAFTKTNVDTARIFIEAMRQRTETITRTMKAIIDLQRAYILSGDDSDLVPMTLRIVAEKTGYDISTISRVSRAKYVQTPWGTFPLRHFFSDGYTTSDGDTMSTREIKNALRDIIANEDRRHPLSDDKLVKVMTEKGYPIARRTIAKYREQMNIPVARLRLR